MSLLAATQIPKPADEQAFERASVVLWSALLDDPNVQRVGRRGQPQNGVDLYGIRGGDVDHHVGIQCKLKGDGQRLTESEVRTEVRKALTFRPALKEYFIVTTAPDDVSMQELARQLTAELKRAGTPMRVLIWGWNTLEERITQNAAARNVFDPSSNPLSEDILSDTRTILLEQSYLRSELLGEFHSLSCRIDSVLSLAPGDGTVAGTTFDAHLDAEIDALRDLSNRGKPQTALELLKGLLDRVNNTASGRILFRIKANIGSCLYSLGRDDEAASILADAYDHAPTEPTAIANRALSLLLQGRWKELIEFGVRELTADPTNEGLAGYLIQTGRYDEQAGDPIDLIPAQLRDSLAVRLGRIDFFRWRRPEGQWWPLAHEAREAFPDDAHAIQFSAEATIDEILSSDSYRQTGVLSCCDRDRLRNATDELIALWDDARVSEAPIRPKEPVAQLPPYAAECVSRTAWWC